MYQYVSNCHLVYAAHAGKKVTSMQIYIVWFLHAIFICLNRDRSVILGAFLMAAC